LSRDPTKDERRTTKRRRPIFRPWSLVFRLDDRTNNFREGARVTWHSHRSCASIPGVSWLRLAIPGILATVPPLYLLYIIFTQTVDVPFADQWALVPLLAHSYEGTLTFHDLWAQHNEHRLLFPRLLMLGLARLSGWNTQVEMFGNVVLAGATCSILVYQLRSTGQLLGMRWIWLVPVISLAIFSLDQAEGWWGGWNLQIFVCVLAVSASIVLLTQPTQRWATLLLALLCGIVATYSYSTGLLIWGVGLVLFAFAPRSRTTTARIRIGLWSAGSLLTAATFFYTYTWSAVAAPPAVMIQHPRPYLLYTITYLGAPPTRGAVEYLFGQISGDTQALCNLGDSDLCSYVNNTAMLAGLGGLLLFMLAIWALLRRVPVSVLLPYLGLGLYALGSGVVTSLGRASYGNHQALAQRYATSASLFWLALVVLGALCGHVYARRRWVCLLSRALILLFSLLTALSSIQGLDHFRWQRAFLAPARDALFTLQDDALLQRLYFDVDVVKQGAHVLRQHHLSVFRQ
jgi:hypothetical protein